eukprot:5327609-Pyramimonas_sp.AAC.1
MRLALPLFPLALVFFAPPSMRGARGGSGRSPPGTWVSDIHGCTLLIYVTIWLEMGCGTMLLHDMLT